MLKFNKPLGSSSALPLINASLGLSKANRSWAFRDDDHFLKVQTQYESGSAYFGTEEDKQTRRHYLTFRYDSISLLREFLKASLDLDFQGLLSSFLVSHTMSGARRVTHYEVGREGIRSGLEVSQINPGDHYHSEVFSTTFNSFVQGFLEYYNESSDLLGTFTQTSLSHVSDHKPVFSHGSYKGSIHSKALGKALKTLEHAKFHFEQFFDSLRQDTGTPHRLSSTDSQPELFDIRLLQLSGTGNTVSYGSSGHSQQLSQSDPIRNKDGLYAIIKLPRLHELKKASNKEKDKHDAESLDPVTSPFMNPYADLSCYGLGFIGLSGCIVIKLGTYLNKAPLTYTTPLSTALSLEADNGNSNSSLLRSRTDNRDHYSTIGPVMHAVYPERVYRQVLEAQNRKVPSSLGIDRMESAPEGAGDNQELLDLTYNPLRAGGPTESYPGKNMDHVHFFGSNIVEEMHESTRHGYRRSHTDQDTPLEHLRPGIGLLAESKHPYYGWFAASRTDAFSPTLESGHLDGVGPDGTRNVENSSLRWIDYGSPNKTHSNIVGMRGAIKVNSYLSQHGEKENRRHTGYYGLEQSKQTTSDTFVFYAQQQLCQDKFHLDGAKSVLSDYAVTTNPALRGKGVIFVDHDSIAYCPLSGDALYVMTYLKIGTLAGHYGYWNTNVHNTAIPIAQ